MEIQGGDQVVTDGCVGWEGLFPHGEGYIDPM